MSLLVYAMSCFKLPVDTCKNITSAMVEFWWNNEKEKRKIPWVSWRSMCRLKEKGGLGFRDIGRFNQASLGKQAWRIWENSSSLLAQILKHKYFKNKSFLTCGYGTRPSYAWRSILFGQELLNKGLIKSIGNGEDTKVWSDNWLNDVYPRSPKPRVEYMRREDDFRVAELWYPNYGNTLRILIFLLFCKYVLLQLCVIISYRDAKKMVDTLHNLVISYVKCLLKRQSLVMRSSSPWRGTYGIVSRR
ncbi:putative mitochondrial protein [Cardamine amara subsp. amara]|uniref:Mitochondrial protein n=1 Tax=Cardamine amara subsp. amara TaxID=228776 RepID=A0ABD1BCN0_CARAN